MIKETAREMESPSELIRVYSLFRLRNLKAVFRECLIIIGEMLVIGSSKIAELQLFRNEIQN